MKRLLYALIALILILSVFGLSCFAETEATEPEIAPEVTPEVGETTENGEEPSENPSQGAETDFIDEIIAIVTNGEIWANFGIIASGVVALIVAVTSKFNDIVKAFNVTKDMIGGKATKEETKEVVTNSIYEVKTAFDASYAELSGKYAKLEQNYNAQTAVITLLALQLVKSPNARTEIMKLLENTDIACDNVAEVVEAVQAEIKAADEAMPKVETPTLTALVEEVKAENTVMSLE